MDVSRLASVAADIVMELDEWQIREKLQAVVQTLQQSTSSPAPEHAEEFRKALAKLDEALRECPSSTFRPSEMEILNEIGAASLVGVRLASKIAHLAGSLGATPSLIISELGEIISRLDELHITLTALSSAFSTLEIEPDSLEPGEGEVGVIIPLSFSGSRLEKLRDELQVLNRYLAVFPQLFDEESKPLEVRSISTGTWEVFLHTSGTVAMMLAVTIERIVALYKSVLEIRLLKQQLTEKNIDPKANVYVEEKAQQEIEDGLTKLHADLLKDALKPDAGRHNELSNNLSMTLRYLADRIDTGFTFEAAVGFPDDEEEEGDEDGTPEGGPSPDEVRKLVSSMAQLERSPQPVLKLSGTWQDTPDQMTMNPQQEETELSEEPETDSEDRT